MINLLRDIGALGDRPDDTESERIRHQFLVWMGILMSCGGIVWGSVSAYYGLVLAAVIPYGYTVLTALNLAYFRFSRDWHHVRLFQVLISLLLPFLFQWSLGGFTDSGAVMLWAMLALVGSLTFSEWRSSVSWLAMYLLLTVVSGLLDSTVQAAFSQHPPSYVQTLFFVANVVVISTIVFGLTIYLNVRQGHEQTAAESARAQLAALNLTLEDEVVSRTAALDAALASSRAIMDHMDDGLIALDVNGVIQSANPAFTKLLTIPEDFTEQSADHALPGALARLAIEAIRQKSVHKKEVYLPGERTGSAVASPIISDGKAVGAVVILRDITLEKEIDRMKTDFIATVSHELRTPLTSILGFAKITRNKLDKRVFHHVPEDDARAMKAVTQARGNFSVMIQEGERLTTLINDVLDISKMEAGRMEWRSEPVDPKDIITRTIAATQPLLREGMQLVPHLDDVLPTLTGDPDRLLQLMINLVSNAIKFTQYGEIVVCARNVDGGVQLCCKDPGEGISPENLPTIFEKFRQVGDTLTDRPTGTGLGLPICRQIARAHGGDISVESTIGEGSFFSVVLPISSDAP